MSDSGEFGNRPRGRTVFSLDDGTSYCALDVPPTCLNFPKNLARHAQNLSVSRVSSEVINRDPLIAT